MYNLNHPCCNSSLFLTDLPVKDHECIHYLFATAFYIFESCYHDTLVLPSLYSKKILKIQFLQPFLIRFFVLFCFFNRLLRTLVFSLSSPKLVHILFDLRRSRRTKELLLMFNTIYLCSCHTLQMVFDTIDKRLFT